MESIAFMHDESAIAASSVIFGWNAVWVSVIIFLLTYAIIMSERVNRAIVALLGAALMIVCGVLNQEAAIRGVDFNTLGLLTGMMVIVAITKRCGVFEYVAIWSAKRVRAHPVGLLLMLSLVTAVFSALLDNVTTVLLVVPVTLLITAELKVNPYPFLFAQIFASNIGGSATLIGDPPNIMIGSATRLTFNDFVINLGPIALVILLVTMSIIYLMWRNGLNSSKAAQQRIMAFEERQAITDVRLLKQSLSVLAVVILGFVLAHPLHLEPATVAMFGAAALLLIHNLGHHAEKQSEQVHHTFGEVEWITIFFFLGLFVLVHGLEHTGVLSSLAEQVIALTKGDLVATSLVVLWVSAVVSALVDNIPFVATMIPMVKSMAPNFGGLDNLIPLWWCLALGACLGGNGSLIGASANLIVAGFAERSGHRIQFLKFIVLAFPLMLISILVATVYVYFRYLT